MRSSAYQAVSRSRRAACVVVQAYARRRLARREGRARRAKLEEQRARRVSVMAARTQEDIGVAARVIQLHCRQARRTLNFKVARYEASAWAHGSALSLRAEGAPPAVALEQLSVELEQKARRAQRRLADVELAPKAKAKAKAVALAAKETAVVARARSRVAPELRAKLAGWGKRFGQGAAQLTPDEEAAAVARLRRSFVEADARLRALGGGGGGASAGALEAEPLLELLAERARLEGGAACLEAMERARPRGPHLVGQSVLLRLQLQRMHTPPHALTEAEGAAAAGAAGAAAASAALGAARGALEAWYRALSSLTLTLTLTPIITIPHHLTPTLNPTLTPTRYRATGALLMVRSRASRESAVQLQWLHLRRQARCALSLPLSASPRTSPYLPTPL